MKLLEVSHMSDEASASLKIVPLMAKAEPISDGGKHLWDNIFKKGKCYCAGQQLCSSKISEEGGGGQRCFTQQPVVKQLSPWSSWGSMMEQIFTCSPCRRPMPEQVDAQRRF